MRKCIIHGKNHTIVRVGRPESRPEFDQKSMNKRGLGNTTKSRRARTAFWANLVFLGPQSLTRLPRGAQNDPFFSSAPQKWTTQKRGGKNTKKGVSTACLGTRRVPCCKAFMACNGKAEQGLARLGPQGAGGLFALRVTRRGIRRL